MNARAAVLALVFAGLTFTGCQRERHQSAEGYDAARDGSAASLPPMARAHEDEIRAAITGERPETVAAAGAAARRDPVEAVRQAVADAHAALKADDYEPALQLFSDEDATILSHLLASSERVDAKGRTLERLVQDRFGTQVPQALSTDMPAGSAADMLPLPSLDEATFELLDDGTVAVTAGDDTSIFEQVAGEWKLRWDPAARTFIVALGELVTVMERVIDGVITGIEAGRIDMANMEAEFERIAAEAGLEQVAEKFAGAMMEMMAGGLQEAFGDPVVETPQPQPQPQPRPGPRMTTQEPAAADPHNLTINETYRLRDPVQMTLGTLPGRGEVAELSAGTQVRLLEVRGEGANQFYRVGATASDGARLTGWLNAASAGPAMELVNRR